MCVCVCVCVCVCGWVGGGGGRATVTVRPNLEWNCLEEVFEFSDLELTTADHH